MQKQSKRKPPMFSNFGFSSILLSFIMICIITFSALSLLTTNSDYRLSKKVAEKNTAYYSAENSAYETLNQIDKILTTSYKMSMNEQDFWTNTKGLISEIEEITWVENNTGYFLSYQQMISDNQQLAVTIQLHYPTGDTDPFYRIIEWKSVTENTNIEEEPLNLIGS